MDGTGLGYSTPGHIQRIARMPTPEQVARFLEKRGVPVQQVRQVDLGTPDEHFAVELVKEGDAVKALDAWSQTIEPMGLDVSGARMWARVWFGWKHRANRISWAIRRVISWR